MLSAHLLACGRLGCTNQKTPTDICELGVVRARRWARARCWTDSLSYERAAGRISETAARRLAPLAITSTQARAVKRVIDLMAAMALLLVGTPLCMLVGLFIRLEDGGPILFRQVRVGRRGALFTLYKLRSMRPDAEAESGPQWAAVDDHRVTRIGWWIRALRIDEIPQAWNVLLGQMSLVGPRPERPEFVELLRDEIVGYDRRLLVRPGITGWAQVNQIYAGTVEDARVKLGYDIEYLERYSAWLDLRIMIRTMRIILFGWGRTAGNGA